MIYDGLPWEQSGHSNVLVWRFSGFQDGVIQAVETSKGRLCGHESLNYSGFCECFALLILQQTYPKTVEINWFSKLSRKLYIYRNGGFSTYVSVLANKGHIEAVCLSE